MGCPSNRAMASCWPLRIFDRPQNWRLATSVQHETRVGQSSKAANRSNTSSAERWMMLMGQRVVGLPNSPSPNRSIPLVAIAPSSEM